MNELIEKAIAMAVANKELNAAHDALVEAMERYKQSTKKTEKAGEEFFDQLAKDDVRQSGNYGWESRFVRFICELVEAKEGAK